MFEYIYKKKKVDISFEVIECVHENRVLHSHKEWIDILYYIAKQLDYRAEFESNVFKSSPAKLEIADVGCLYEDEINTDELWERYGDGQYFCENILGAFMDKAEQVIKDYYQVDINDFI